MIFSASRGGTLYDVLHGLGMSAGSAARWQSDLARPLEAVLVVFVALIAGRLGSGLIRKGPLRVRKVIRRGDPIHANRVDTVLRIVANAWRVTIAVVALLTIFTVVGINLGPFLAGATVIGATIGFGAQSLVRDFLSGMLMLVEDQYSIGDVVTVNDLTGTVEEVTLRVTRLRTADGTAWFIPNGQILRLGNSSRNWSRALVSVAIAPSVSIPEATKLIEEAADAALDHPDLEGKVRSEAHVLGVSAVDAQQVTVDVEVQTAPLAADVVARVVREAVIGRLAAEHMLPQPTVSG